MKPLFILLTALFLALVHELPAAEKDQFIVPPEVVIRHTPERSFIGPGMLGLEHGDILMAAPWGRPHLEGAGRALAPPPPDGWEERTLRVYTVLLV